MAAYTLKYNLKKPAQSDYYNVDDFNGNMDKVEAELAKRLPATNGKIPSPLIVEGIDTDLILDGMTQGTTWTLYIDNKKLMAANASEITLPVRLAVQGLLFADGGIDAAGINASGEVKVERASTHRERFYAGLNPGAAISRANSILSVYSDQYASGAGMSQRVYISATGLPAGTGTAMQVVQNVSDGSYGLVRSSSSRRYKENFESVNDDEVQKLQDIDVVGFKYKTDPDGVKNIGVIAEEIAEVLPELVIYRRNDNGELVLDENGERICEDVNHRSIQYLMLKLAQEQEKRVAALEAEIKELKEMIKCQI